MVNLLSPRGTAAVKHEYVLRVGAVFCFLLAGVFIAATALTIPTYVITSAQMKTIREDNGEMQETNAAFESAAGELKMAKTLVSQLKTTQGQIHHSQIISTVRESAPDGVTFSRFQISQTNGIVSAVQVNGTAATRESLIGFKTALEASSMFDTANIPLGDLARDSNLPFSLNVTMAKP